MKIINICAILPIKGLQDENDINIVIQQRINELNPNIDFVFFKWLPYVNSILTIIKPKWKKYKEYQRKKFIYSKEYKTYFFPWIAPPTSNFRLNSFLILFNNVFLLNKILRIISNDITDASLLISQTNIPDAVLALKLSKKYNIPYIHVVRGTISKEVYNSRIIKSVLNNAERIITPSPTAYKYLQKKYNITLLPHGVDSDFFFKGQKKYSKAKFITVSRLLSLKNIDKVIIALLNAKNKGLDFEYIVIGDGSEYNLLNNLVRKYNLEDRVRLLGSLKKENVIKHLFESNIFIMPSFPETLGRAFQEAAAAKCLCIGHVNSGIDGLLIHNKSGLFVSIEDLNKTIEDAIININTPKYNTIINNAYKEMIELTWDSVSKKYISIFEECIKH